MTNSNWESTEEESLRLRAEEVYKESLRFHEIEGSQLTREDTRRILHELRVHQIELEMQNDELRKTQIELDNARNRYFDLYDLAPVGYCTITEKGIIQEANLTAAKLLGCERGSLLMRPLTLFIHKEDQDLYYLYRKRLGTTEGHQTCELRMVRHDSKEFWARLEASAEEQKDKGSPYRVIISDITLRMKEEETLRLSEARYRSIIEDQSELICRYLPDGRLSFVNEAYARYYQKDRLELINTNFIPEIPEPDMGMILNLLGQISMEHPVVDFTHRIVSPQGEIRWQRWTQRGIYSQEGKLLEYQAVGFDITERKKAEEALKEASLYARNLIETSLDPLVTLSVEGKITDVNRAMEKITGKTRQNLIGSDFSQYFTQPEMAQAIYEKVYALGEITDYSLAIRHDSGLISEVLFNATLFKNDQGEILGIFAAARDITERKRTEEQVRNLQKTESLGLMAAAVAHHFNNKLQAVMGCLELAMEYLPDRGKVLSILNDSMTAAKKAAEMSNLMLLYLGQSFRKMAPLNLSDLCEECLPGVRQMLPDSITLKTELVSPGPMIKADEDQIKQIVTNLVNNAWESIDPNPGTIKLTIQVKTPKVLRPEYTFPLGWHPKDCPHACMEVWENGCGISEQDLKKIFDPFFSTKFTGRGMGLAVVLGIVRIHEGGITVESTPGKGSTFRVYLPMID